MQLFDWHVELVVVAAAHRRIQGSTRDAPTQPPPNPRAISFSEKYCAEQQTVHRFQQE